MHRNHNLEKYIKETYHVEALAIKCDISNEEEVENMVNQIIDTFGGLTLLYQHICLQDKFLLN